MYVRYSLSLRQVEDLLCERGIDICHETVRYRWTRVGPLCAAEIRKRRVPHRCYSLWRWHLDEVCVRINGKTHSRWRAVDHEGEVVEVFVTKRRDRRAAREFQTRAMMRYGRPASIVTDRRQSYRAALKVIGHEGGQEPGAGSTTGRNTHIGIDAPICQDGRSGGSYMSRWPLRRLLYVKMAAQEAPICQDGRSGGSYMSRRPLRRLLYVKTAAQEAPICQDGRSGGFTELLARAEVSHDALIDFPSEKAFKASDDVPFRPSIRPASDDIVDRRLVIAHTDHDGSRECPTGSRKSAATVNTSYPTFCISATLSSSRSRCAFSIQRCS